MILSWLMRLLSSKRSVPLDPAAWQQAIGELPFLTTLGPGDRTRLIELAQSFERAKSWEGCGGLELTEAMRASISIQACLLVLNLDHRLYQRVREILVYPSTYRGPDGASARAGEAWLRGPVILSWDAAHEGGRDHDDGRNTVFHEFAHKLDFLDDQGDGVPPLSSEAGYRQWNHIADKEYEKLVRHANSNKATLLDHYGATNPAEFFAVATECFFEQPRKLKKKHRDLYELLSAFYRQDPARNAVAAR